MLPLQGLRPAAETLCHCGQKLWNDDGVGIDEEISLGVQAVRLELIQQPTECITLPPPLLIDTLIDADPLIGSGQGRGAVLTIVGDDINRIAFFWVSQSGQAL